MHNIFLTTPMYIYYAAFDDFENSTKLIVYEPQGLNVTCVFFTIKDDQLIEPTEQFSVVFNRTGPADKGNNTEASITIMDNDSKFSTGMYVHV